MNPNHLIQNRLAWLLPLLNSQNQKLKTPLRRHLPPTALCLQILLAVRQSVSNAGALNALSSPRRQYHAHP